MRIKSHKSQTATECDATILNNNINHTMGSSGGGDDDDTRQLDSAGRLMDGYPNLCINVQYILLW